MTGCPSPPISDSSLPGSRLRAGSLRHIYPLGTAGQSSVDSRDSEFPVNIVVLRPSDCSVVYGEILSGEVSPLRVTREVHYVGSWGGPGVPGMLLIASRCEQ
jgi:hypothetical protein